LDTSNTLATFSKHTGIVNKVLRINAQQMVTVGDDTMVKLWNMATGAYICSYNHTAQVKSVVVLPNGFLATGACDNNIHIWNLTNGLNYKTLTGHAGCITDLKYNKAVNTSGGALISASTDKTVKVWDLTDNSCTLLTTLGPVSQPINCLAVMPTSGNIIAGSNLLDRWTPSFSYLGSAINTANNVISMAVYPDGVTLACGMQTGIMNVVNMTSLSIVLSISAHSTNLNTVDAIQLPGSSQLYFMTGSEGGSVKIWLAEGSTWSNIKQFNFASSAVKSVYFLFNETALGNISIVFFFINNFLQRIICFSTFFKVFSSRAIIGANLNLQCSTSKTITSVASFCGNNNGPSCTMDSDSTCSQSALSKLSSLANGLENFSVYMGGMCWGCTPCGSSNNYVNASYTCIGNSLPFKIKIKIKLSK
jgi:WD40 repeat protein